MLQAILHLAPWAQQLCPHLAVLQSPWLALGLTPQAVPPVLSMHHQPLFVHVQPPGLSEQLPSPTCIQESIKTTSELIPETLLQAPVTSYEEQASALVTVS